MTKLGRNDTCHCGSGLKYKKCHLQEDEILRFGAEFVKKFVPESAMYRFDQFLPEVAHAEGGRAIWVNKDPAKNEPYFLAEYYCGDPACDCKRVIIGVIDMDHVDQGTLVSVSYAFDRNDPEPGPYIDPLNPITDEGRRLFPLVADMLENDTAYVQRLQGHYRMVKAKISQGTRLVH